MVARKNHRPTEFRLPAMISAVLVATLLVMLSLDSCQFLGSDMFPTTLSREDAVMDLDAKLADLGVTGEYEVPSMKFLTSPTTGKEYIFVRIAKYSEDPGLIVLDASDLSVVKAIQSPAIGDMMIVDMQGYFACGNDSSVYRFDTSTLDFVDTRIPSTQISGNQVFTESALSWNIWYDSSNTLYYQTYSNNWVQSFNTSCIFSSTFYDGLYLVSSSYYNGKIQLMFSSSNKNAGFIASFPDTSTFSNSFIAPSIFEYSGTTVVPIPSGDDNSGWLTRNGAIILTHENDTRLVRYESDSGKELDSFILNDTEDTRFAFSPDGKKWLMYDGVRGKLHLLRTWW